MENLEPRPVPHSGNAYHKQILDLLPQYPHLEALLLYSTAIEKARNRLERGSHESDSILVAETAHDNTISFDAINVYNSEDVKAHKEVLSGAGSPQLVKARLLLVEDVSPGAIEALGAGFNLNPHVFYFHLGFDTRGSAMQEFIDPTGEGRVPVTWYFPSHGPEDFISIPLQCDLTTHSKIEENIPVDTTYCRQFYRSISQVTSENQPTVMRGFHRISVAFAQTTIKTTIILAFPNWKRISSDGTNEILDSHGYPLVPPSMPLHMTTEAVASPEVVTKEQKGKWSPGQCERVQPLFHSLLCSRSWNIANHDFIRERVLLWLYSKVSFNYYLASQNDSRCWRDVRSLNSTGRISGKIALNVKKDLRDNMTKHTELLEIAKMSLDQALEHVVDDNALLVLQRRVNELLMFQHNRIDMVLKNIAESEH